MTRTAALVLAAWTAAGAANAQTIRIDFDNGGRGGDSIREALRGQPVPRAPQGREVRGGRGGQESRRGGGRADRMRGSPDRWNGGGVRGLAARVEADAAALRRDYGQNSRTGNFFEKLSRAAGLQALDNVSDAARGFSRELNSRWSDPWETRENYLDLARALDDADETFRFAYKAGSVREQYRRVSDGVDELGRYYRRHDGGYGRPDDRPYGRERCEGVSMWGKWYEGGGCGIHGCWKRGGGCSHWGCWREGGNCGIHGCIGQVPSQVCVE